MSTPPHDATGPLPEQGFVDRAYERLDDLRASYRERQRRSHAVHGVGNAQAWTERDAISSHLGDVAARLEGIEERLVFGRLDMASGTTHHIGRASLSQESGSPLLIDWRAPAARPFYQATAVDPAGVVRRRHITTRGRRVTALEDELLDASHPRTRDLDLQGEGALMSALDAARDGRMGDIVATIQAEQDRIIRAPERGLVVVQGGPGTGKTAVALHRIAYLLYSQRERLERSGVLLVGPSRIFLRYIEQVLPSLGETGVVSMTLDDLVPGVRPRGVDSDEAARLKGLPAWSRILKQAVLGLVRIPESDQELRVWNRRVVLRRGDVEAAVRRAKRSGRPHNAARESFALDVMRVLAERLAVEAGDVDASGAPLADEVTAWLGEIRDSADARRAINLAWMPTAPTTLLSRLYSRPEVLARANGAAGHPLRGDELAVLVRARTAPLTSADVPLIDELEELLGPMPGRGRSSHDDSGDDGSDVARARSAIESQGLGGGIVTAEMLAASTRPPGEWTPLAERAMADRQWTYGHVVVDEAQDLSPMAWRALLRRCPARSFTVVGDLDQRRGPRRPLTWAQALGPAARALETEYALTVSYRTPRTLTALAEAVMARNDRPVLHPMTAVRDVEDCYSTCFVPGSGPAPRDRDPLWAAAHEGVDAACARLDEASGAGSGRVAVLVGQERAVAWGADLRGDSGLSERVCVLSAAAAKGLEFDSVVLVEPSEILADGPGDLFVALTRATHDVRVVHSGDLPRGMEEWD
ncbi:AAA family ATPase [Actinomyces sp. B33]|uniref:HelD family protein n=1 Tax=Actinomyces sp. B33 TaxID=2942131 RepID=UPI0023412F49|nr:AAA family ATPase [Actinomyces sp. B33]MDC4233069.1 AAA family ATPase [Actinomyces sp. B33]